MYIAIVESEMATTRPRDEAPFYRNHVGMHDEPFKDSRTLPDWISIHLPRDAHRRLNLNKSRTRCAPHQGKMRIKNLSNDKEIGISLVEIRSEIQERNWL